MTKLDELVERYSCLWTDKLAERVAIEYSNYRIDDVLESLSDNCVSVERDKDGEFYWIAEVPNGPFVDGHDKQSLLTFIKEE